MDNILANARPSSAEKGKRRHVKSQQKSILFDMSK